jgi:hypothetical protein
MDLGLTPAAVIGQQDPRGRALILAEAVSFDMGVQRFMRTVLKPMLYEQFPGAPVIIVTDPAGTQRAQTDEPKGDGVIDKNNHSHVAEALQYLMLHIAQVADGGTVLARREVKPMSAVGWT